MSKVFLLFLVIASIFSSVESFVGSSGKLCRFSNVKATYPSALLMSKASQEKADEKKRKQAMVSPLRLPYIVTLVAIMK